MKQFYQSFVIVALTFVAVLAGCGSDHDKNAGGSTEDLLPKIQSFKVETNFSISDNGIGVTRLSYDSKGRIVNYVTDKIEEKYSYTDDGKCRMEGFYRASNSLMETADIRFNDKGQPVEEYFKFIDTSSPDDSGEVQITRYIYDEKGRMLCHDCKSQSQVNDIIIKTDFTYDSSTGLVSEAKVWRRFPGYEDTNQIFRLEYSDRDNPLAFYPENMLWFSFDSTVGMGAQSGYGRDKLLDKMWISTFEGVLTAVVTFAYDFSPANKLTGIYISYHEVDSDGNQLPEFQYFNITEISY